MDTLYHQAQPRAVYLSPVVRQMHDLKFTGNIVPHSWAQHPLLRSDDGRPNLLARIVLAEILYWHRPYIEMDEATGRIIMMRNRFKGKKHRVHYDFMARKLGVTTRMVKDCMTFLVNKGIIEREVVTLFFTDKKPETGAVFITPKFAAIVALNEFPDHVYAPDPFADEVSADSVSYDYEDVPDPAFAPFTEKDTGWHAETCHPTRQSVPPRPPKRVAPHAETCAKETIVGDDIYIRTTKTTKTAGHANLTSSAARGFGMEALLGQMKQFEAVRLINKNDETQRMIFQLTQKALTSIKGVDAANMLEIISEASDRDCDGKRWFDRVECAIAWYPSSKACRTAKQHGGVFRCAVREDWAQRAIDIPLDMARAKQADAEQVERKRRNVEAKPRNNWRDPYDTAATVPSDEDGDTERDEDGDDKQPAEKTAQSTKVPAPIHEPAPLDFAALFAPTIQPAQAFTDDELAAVADSMSVEAQMRVLSEAVELACSRNQANRGAIRGALEGVMPQKAAGHELRIARKEVLNARAKNPMQLGDKVFYDKDDYANAQEATKVQDCDVEAPPKQKVCIEEYEAASQASFTLETDNGQG